jgi:hypothetical protein
MIILLLQMSKYPSGDESGKKCWMNACFLKQNGSVLRVKANTGESLWLKFSVIEKETRFVGQDTSRVKENVARSVYWRVTKTMRLECKICTKPRMTIPSIRIRTFGILKAIMSFNLRKTSGIDGMWASSKRVSNVKPLTHLFKPFIRLSYFPSPWKEAKVVTLLRPGKDPKSSQYLRPIILLTTTGKIFEKIIHKIFQRHIDEQGLLNTSQFGFRAPNSTTLQCMRLMDHTILNFNNTWIRLRYIKKAFDIAWHLRLLYNLLILNFSISTLKLITLFLQIGKL